MERGKRCPDQVPIEIWATDDDEIMEEGFGVDSGNKLKGIRESAGANHDDIKQVYPKIRDRTPDDEYKISLSDEFMFDPPHIDRFLAFGIDLERENVIKLKHRIENGGQLEIIECTKELGELITADPRLAIFLEEQFFKLLVDFLHAEQNRVLQVNVVNILIPVVGYSDNREIVIRYIKVSTIVRLFHSKDFNLIVQALWLLRSIVLVLPHHPEIKTMIEETLESVVHFISEHSCEDSIDHKVLRVGSMTLAALCQEHPQLPLDKLELALRAIRKLFRYDNHGIVSNACKGFSDLCDGNKRVVVDREYLNYVVERLIVLIDSEARVNIILGLKAMGSIVRWGTDDDIQVIIDKKGLWSLECLLDEDDKYYVMDPCWILSNITARHQNHIEAVIKHKCIDSLVGVIKNHKLAVVKEEATWAILNAIRRASINQLQCLMDCVKPVWGFMKELNHFETVSACLEKFMSMESINATCIDEMVNDVRFADDLEGFGDDLDGLPKLKRLRG